MCSSDLVHAQDLRHTPDLRRAEGNVAVHPPVEVIPRNPELAGKPCLRVPLTLQLESHSERDELVIHDRRLCCHAGHCCMDEPYDARGTPTLPARDCLAQRYDVGSRAMSTPQTRSPHEVVAGEVRASLARQRVSGRAAARTLGWTSDYIHRRLDGRTPFDANDLVALAALLDVPVASFFAEVPSGTKVCLSPRGKARLTLSRGYLPSGLQSTFPKSRLAA